MGMFSSLFKKTDSIERGTQYLMETKSKVMIIIGLFASRVYNVLYKNGYGYRW